LNCVFLSTKTSSSLYPEYEYLYVFKFWGILNTRIHHPSMSTKDCAIFSFEVVDVNAVFTIMPEDD